MNIPELTGLFKPVPYQAPEDADKNNLSTLSAIADPSGTLQKMQADQIAKAMADAKMEGVDGIYKDHALKAIQDFQDKSMKMYKSNKGFNRLNLTGQQMLDQSKNHSELILNMTALKALSEDNKKTLEEVSRDFHEGIINRDDYDKFTREFDDKTKNAKSIGDLPHARAMYNNQLMNKPYDMDAMMKTANAAMKDVPVNTHVEQRGDERYNIQSKDVAPVAEALWGDPKVRKLWTDQAGGNVDNGKIMFRNFMQGFNKSGETYGGQRRESEAEKLDFWNKTQGSKQNKPEQTVEYDHTMRGWDFSTLDKKPRFSGVVTDADGNEIQVKDAEMTDAVVNGSKYDSNLSGEGVYLSGPNAGTKTPLSNVGTVSANDKEVNDALEKQKVQRTFNGEKYTGTGGYGKKATTTPGKKKKNASDYGL